jgi:hypothetical protein
VKRLSWLAIVGLFTAALSVPGTVSAFTLGVDYDETIQDNGIGATGFDYVSTIEFREGAGLIRWLHTDSWAHTLSADYMPVPDAFQVTSARLDISGCRYLGFGSDMVEFAGSYEWSHGSGWRWIGPMNGSFDLSGIDNSYWNQDVFEVAMTPIFDLGVRVGSSVLSIDYAPADNFVSGGGVSAVPEPATALLLGFGLIGVIGYRLRRHITN